MFCRPLEMMGRLSGVALLLWLCCAHAAAQTWVPASPSAVIPNQISVFSCQDSSGVNARWVFGDGGFRVTQPPVISRNGQTISLDARVEETTGVRTLAIVPFDKNFDTGQLAPGTYTLEFRSWGTILKTLEFTVKETPFASQPIDQRCFFVTMEYFGYLRRDPDPDGFQFWLAKLNQFNGDFSKAEMVKAFISSTEYRSRFQ